MGITSHYKTSAGTLVNTEQEALLTEYLEQTEGIYIESYRMKGIVEVITKNFFLVPIQEVEEMQQEAPAPF